MQANLIQIQNNLNNVIKLRSKFNDLSVNSKVDNKILSVKESIVDNFIKALNDFYNSINNSKITDFTNFIKKNVEELSKLKDTLDGQYRVLYDKVYDSTIKAKFLALDRKIFIKIKYNDYMTTKQRLVTRLFTDFSKGITFFKKEFQDGRFPVYHRNSSCGSNRITSDIRFTKMQYAQDKSKYIQRCYFERYMYDRIYNNIIGMQDIGHMNELQLITRIYESYFPQQTINIYLQFIGDYPIAIIFELNKENKYDKTVIFKKKLKADNTYEDNISCIYTDNMDKTNNSITDQTFDSIKEFVIAL